MKRELFNVADEEFMVLLDRANRCFVESGIPHMFVGGVANQIHIANYLCQVAGKNLLDLVNTEDIRMQDHLRSTDDVDIAYRLGLRGGDNEESTIRRMQAIYRILDRIVEDEVYLSPSEQHLVSIKISRRAHSRPKFNLSVDGVEYDDKDVTFNLYGAPKEVSEGNLKEFEDRFYDLFLSRAVNINLPYSERRNIHLRVKSPVDQLITKVVRGRPKDISDAMSLIVHSNVTGSPIDLGEARKVLCSPDSRYGCQSDYLCERYDKLVELTKSLDGE